MPIDNCGEIISATLDFTEENCNIQLDFKNGESFSFEAGLTEIKKTDSYDTHVVSMQPFDENIPRKRVFVFQFNKNVKKQLDTSQAKIRL